MIPESLESRRVKLICQLDSELQLSRLMRRSFPESPRNLFKAISDALYYRLDYCDQIVDLCRNELRRRLDSNSLPSKLVAQFQNRDLIDDYYENPDLNGFLKVHLGLVSLAFDKKITLYYLGDDGYLNSLIINHSSNKSQPIVLCRVQNTYGAVQSVEVSEVAKMVKQMIGDKLMGEPLVATEAEKMERAYQTPRKTHKKSLSVCDELEYKEIFKSPMGMNLPQSSRFIKYPTIEDDSDALTLLSECNINGKVSYPHNIMESRVMEALSSASYFHRAESVRVVSFHNPNNKEYEMTNSSGRHSGRLKFFDENKNYGFIVMDQDLSDIFVHHDDLLKAGMTKQFMRTTKQGNIIRFEFSSMTYIGKYDKSRKAVDLLMVKTPEFMPI